MSGGSAGHAATRPAKGGGMRATEDPRAMSATPAAPVAQAAALAPTAAASGKTYAETRLGALLKEYEFLRAEQLMCIGRVRYLAMFAIGIAGASLPAIATIIASKESGPLNGIGEIVKDRGLLLQLIALGVSLCACALLQIYIGVFKQIFAFATYFRVVLVPDINATAARLSEQPEAQIFQWEVWLQKERERSTLHKADTDLEAEPILISAVAVVYMLAGLAISAHTRELRGAAALATIILAGFIFAKYRSFRNVLKKSTDDSPYA